MKINKTFFYIAIVFIVSFILFLLVPYKSKNKKNNQKQSNESKLTLEQFQKEMLSNFAESEKDSFEYLSKNIENATDSLSKTNAYSAIISFLNKIEKPELASMYVFRKAEWIKNSNSWVLTGDNFINLLLYDSVSKELVEDIKSKATYSYQNATVLDSLNTEAKLKYAQCLMEFKNEPMQGVQILLKIVEKNPKQIEALMLLAKYGLVSGQNEKVEQRLSVILAIEPKNIQALLMKADLYQQLGKKKESNQIIQNIILMPNVSKELKSQLEVALKN